MLKTNLDNGPQTKSGEQGYIDDERSCFWIRDDNEYAWQSRPFKGRQVRRRKGKEKRKKENGSKGKRGKKGFSNGNEGLQEGGFSHLPTRIRVQAMSSTRTKAEARTKKGKGEDGQSASQTPSEEGYSHAW